MNLHKYETEELRKVVNNWKISKWLKKKSKKIKSSCNHKGYIIFRWKQDFIRVAAFDLHALMVTFSTPTSGAEQLPLSKCKEDYMAWWTKWI